MDERLKKAAYPGLLQDRPHAREALAYATRHDATPNADAPPLAPGHDARTDGPPAGARQPLAQATRAEVEASLDARAHLRDAAGRHQVVRNGRLPARAITTVAGPVGVKRPRVHDRRPPRRRQKFASALLPPCRREARGTEGLIPRLCLRGVSTGDFPEALAAPPGPQAKGLSAATVTRPKAVWAEGYGAWGKRSPAGRHYVYVWADGVSFDTRLEDGRPCIPALLGATAGGKEGWTARADGYRESEQSWKALPPDGQARGRTTAPLPATGGGAPGFWEALRELFPAPRGQRCRVHKAVNVPDELPKGQQPKAKALRHDPWQAAPAAAEEAFGRPVAT